MHNLFVNQIRIRRPQETAMEDALDEPGAAGRWTALTARDIHDALALLPEEQREVLLLVGLEQSATPKPLRCWGCRSVR